MIRMEKQRLKKIPYGQALVITEYDEQGIIQRRKLKSYDTDVIIVDYCRNENDAYCIMRITGLYSNTTKKHISAFIKEFYSQYDYKMIKSAFMNGINLVWDI